MIPDLPDPLLAEAYHEAAERNVLAALNPEVFFGYWSVCADGQDFGYGNTFPSLDGHQMADALLFLGREKEVLANWDYVRGFQKPDGQLPLAIFRDPASVPSLKLDPNGGLYRHWVIGDPLRALAGPTYIQNADAIFARTRDLGWLKTQLPSVNRAGDFLDSMTTPEGRVGGAGYYIERPTRIESDGVSQCHAVDALRRLAALNRAAGDEPAARRFSDRAERIAGHFREAFWVGDHFAEYIHPERGVMAHHGLTDVDWAAIACDVAGPEQTAVLWPKLRSEEKFHYGGMPSGISTRPETYEDWEFTHPDKHDLAAMGRVWYVECWARWRMGDRDGILDSMRRVARVGREGGWYWRERYYPSGEPAGARKYCEYASNLIRIVHRFLEA